MNPMAGPEPRARLACPRDGAALTVLRHDGVSYHGCAVCRGLLLPFALIGELAALTEAMARKAAAWPHADLRCPRCGQPMRQAHHEGVEIDLCLDCRVVWLDRGEIDAIRPPRPQDAVTEQVKEEAEYQAVNAGVDAILGKDSGLFDWLGDALGTLLS